MNTKHMDSPQATTTEELIVQYLDGELVRKELETMLFERLAQSQEARALLREYLTVRGAIRVSSEDERFQLSSDLDSRTRLRIEQMLEKIGHEEPIVVRGSYASDAAPVQTNAVSRSLKRWSLRPSLAAVLLLFAVGATWFITHESNPKVVAVAVPAPAPSAPSSSSTENSTVVIPHELPLAAAEPAMHKAEAREHRSVATPARYASNAEPSNQAVTTPAASTPAVQQTEDPGDVMMTKRFAKMLNATEKHEVVVTNRDRL